MADEPAAAPQVEDTPVVPEAPAAPDTPTQPESPEVTDYKQRYEDLRPEFDRRNELLADIEGRNGPERQAQALSQHARIELEAEEEEEDDDFELPPDPNEEIAKIRQELADRDEASKEAEFNQLEQQFCESTVESLEGTENFKLSDEEYDFVVNRALANRDEHDGRPDLEGSFKAFKKSILSRNKEHYDSKETFVPPIGTEGEQKIDLRDKEARQAHALKVFEASERSKQT